MYGRRRSFFIGSLLRLISFFYGPIVRLRYRLYRLGFIASRKLQQPVISVGNITVGGTGKTPAVMQIAGMLIKHQKHPAVISRGYGRRNENDLTVVSDGNRVLADTATGGDEPVLISSAVSGVPVLVGSDRHRAGLYACKNFGSDIIILDDGFQHLRLSRNLDIVLIDAVDPFGNGNLFPSGILREPLTALRRADVVLITHADQVQDVSVLRKTISRHTSAGIFTSRLAPVDLIDFGTNEHRPLSSLEGLAVVAFAGIARPESFLSVLRSLGAEVKADIRYPDHYEYKESDLSAICKRANNEKASIIVTTEKDAVRLKSLKPRAIWALRVELNVVENKDWEALLLNL